MSTYNASIVVIQQYFSRRCALANGLFMTGFSLGWLLLPPLLRLVIDMYGWRAGLMVMAMLALQGVVLGALLRPVPAASLQQEDHSKKAYIQQDSSTVPKSDVLPEKRTITRSLFSNVWFIMFLIGDFAIQMGFRTVMVYTPMRCDLLGLTKSQAAWLMSTVGLAGLVGYPVAGWLADRPRIDRVLLFGIGALLSGVAILSTVAMQDFHTLLSGMLLLSTLVGKYRTALYSTTSWKHDQLSSKYLQRHSIARLFIAWSISSSCHFQVECNIMIYWIEWYRLLLS